MDDLPPTVQLYGMSAHDSELQRQHTLLFTHAMLPSVRRHLPGFHAMDQPCSSAAATSASMRDERVSERVRAG